MQNISDLATLQVIELNIMKKIHIFCEKNKITYFLAYGTLIGAMRHGGFIPWDDDIDIWMPRDDFNKFKQLFPEYGEKEKLYIASKDSKTFYPRNLLKVYDGRTLLKEPQYIGQDDFGVFVDIWPLDGTLKNPILRFIHNNYCYFLRNLLYASVTKVEYINGNVIKKFAARVSKVLNPRFILKCQIPIYSIVPLNNSSTVECRDEKPYNLERSAFASRIKVKFEDTEFYAPIGYDSILTKLYGEWRKLPSKEERKPHHIMNIYWKYK